MNRLIINADDFGIHEEVNEAVRLAHEQGILSSTSLLASGRAYEEAVAIAKRFPKLGIGIHLCLVGSLPPLSDPGEVPSLLADDGLFPESYATFIQKAYRGKINYEEVYRELDRQMNKIMTSSLPITHVDSHQHLHVLPPVWRIVCSLMKKYGLHRLRLPREAYCFKMLTARPGRVLGRNGLTFLAEKAARDLPALRFLSTDHFWGMVDGGNMNSANLAYILKQLPFGIHEIMMHPGRNKELLSRRYAWHYHWDEELAALLSPAMKEILQKNRIMLITYGDLP